MLELDVNSSYSVMAATKAITIAEDSSAADWTRISMILVYEYRAWDLRVTMMIFSAIISVALTVVAAENSKASPV